MTYSKTGTERRLERLGRVLAGRRARLAARLARQQRPVAYSGPIGQLQRFGYPIALLLALAGAFPALVGFGWRQRRLLFDAARNRLAIRKLRKRFDSVRSGGSGS